MLKIPKTLIDEYFKHKYTYYKQRENYNYDMKMKNKFDSFEYHVYLTNPNYYLNLCDVCDKIKIHMKHEISRGIEEENVNITNKKYKYYKLNIKYAYGDKIEYYTSPMIKSDSLLKVYEYLLFNKKFGEIRLFDALISMTDCFYVSKISEYDNEFHIILWSYNTFKICDINVFAEYDAVLRDRYESIAIELNELDTNKKDIEDFNNIAFKYPKSETDKCEIKKYINKTKFNNNVLLQLYKSNEIETVDGEHYDLLDFLNNFFVGKCNNFLCKMWLETYEENQVYDTI
jgi:hypothetical protein